MTVDEYLPWAVAQERGRFELHEGRVIMMSQERAAHWKTKGAIFIALTEAIKGAALNCHAVPDGATVRISAKTAFEPDALVYFGDEVPNNSLEVPNPVIVVEVLSPGSEITDMRDKLRGYFTIPSVSHYLIVDPEKRIVIHHGRGSEDFLQTRLVSSGRIPLDPPGLCIDVETLFA